MRGVQADTIDGYLRQIPAAQRAALARLRATIKAAAPGATEGFSYGLPAFKLDGRPLVAFGAASEHCAFYPMSPALITSHAADLAKYDLSKGTIRFAPTKPLPARLVTKLVKARIAELKAGRTAYRRG